MIFLQEGIPDSLDIGGIIAGASFQYGLTPFETIRGYSPRGDHREFLLFAHEPHINRLFRTAHHLDICIPYARADIEHRLIEIVRGHDLTNDYLIKMMLFTTEKSWGSSNNFELMYQVVESPRRAPGQNPAGLMTVSRRRPRDDVLSTRIKVGANYTASRISQRITNKAGFDLPLFLNDLGLVEESSGSTIFGLTQAGSLVTPASLGSSLDSITAEYVIRAASSAGIKTEQKLLTLGELYDCKALFLIGTSVEALQVSRLDHVNYDQSISMEFSSWLLQQIQTKQSHSPDFHKAVM